MAKVTKILGVEIDKPPGTLYIYDTNLGPVFYMKTINNAFINLHNGEQLLICESVKDSLSTGKLRIFYGEIILSNG
jgi:hypothetical protein